MLYLKTTQEQTSKYKLEKQQISFGGKIMHLSVFTWVVAYSWQIFLIWEIVPL